MVNRTIPKREVNETADHWTTRMLSEVVLMTPEEIKRALLDVWNDGYNMQAHVDQSDLPF